MKRKRTSIIWNISKARLQEILTNSNTLAEALETIGVPNFTSGYSILKKRVAEDALDISHISLGLDSNKNRKFKNRKYPDSNKKVFVKNSKVGKQTLKRRVLKEKILEYKCAWCDNNGQWNDKKLSLHLDHINGINNDNRKANLRFLCPNCHSQTKYFGAYNTKKYRSKSDSRCEKS